MTDDWGKAGKFHSAFSLSFVCQNSETLSIMLNERISSKSRHHNEAFIAFDSNI